MQSSCHPLKQAQQGPVDGDTYNSLQMSTVSPSDYEVIRRREGSSQAEDQGTDEYENIKNGIHKTENIQVNSAAKNI
ncbi:hypothetical protein JZ751_010308 [Albula glossodonta]|uniref:Uncharacterized protein n=1 Tax=Albula glossodonta TaxID=121402 RepID=A0A8T2MKB2_9TELE|nr:hypothetical protein JZ751_010308 [Albula glossodonta]